MFFHKTLNVSDMINSKLFNMEHILELITNNKFLCTTALDDTRNNVSYYLWALDGQSITGFKKYHIEAYKDMTYNGNIEDDDQVQLFSITILDDRE